MNKDNMAVLINVLGGVESGGQVYGNRDYGAYEEPYSNTQNEHTITIGWAQNYGAEARTLLMQIFKADMDTFRRIDADHSIEKMLQQDWVAKRWRPSAEQREHIIQIITTDAGKQAQDELFTALMQNYATECEKVYTNDIRAVMMYCEIRHLGGKKAAQRIFDRCRGNYSLETILEALQADQNDTTSNAQVGDKIFWSRHLKCVGWIDKYAKEERKKEMATGAKAITICGHGSGTPSLKNLYTYSASRYNQYASNGKRKGIVCVRRLKAMTDTMRAKFHNTYKTILGRNAYSQNLREYCYIAYNNGKFYSDCSSSICLTYRQIGLYCPSYNTAEIYNSGLFETVEVTIQDGQIIDAEKLKVGDCILYRGNDPQRPLQIGHVEAVYEIAGQIIPDPDPEPPEPPIEDTVRQLQMFLNNNYSSQVKKMCGKLLSLDNEYGKETRAAALAVWKYMANKYAGAKLDTTNRNFGESCKAVAEKFTLSEGYSKHPTLVYILQGILAGVGYYHGEFDAVYPTADVKRFQSARKLEADGICGQNTWYAVFN